MTNIFQPYLDAQKRLKLIDVPEMADFCQLVPKEDFVLSGCIINPKGSGFEVTGSATLFKGSQAMSVTLLATTKGANYQFSLSGNLPSDWKIDNGFGDLPGSWKSATDGSGLLVFGKSVFSEIEIENPAFTIKNYEDKRKGHSKGINLSGTLKVMDYFVEKSKAFLVIPKRIAMTGTVNLHEYGQPVIDLTCSLSSELKLGHLEAKDLSLKVSSPVPTGMEMTSTGMRIESTVGIGTEGTASYITFKLIATVADPERSWLFSLQDIDHSVSLGNGIANITGLAGFEVDLSSLPSPLDKLEKLYLKEFNIGINPSNKTVQGINCKVGLDTTWHLIPGQDYVDIKDPYIGISIINPTSTKYKVTTFSVGGAFSLGNKGTVIDVIAHPTVDFEVNGKLERGDSIQLSDALRQFVNYDNIPELTITALSFSANRQGKLFLQAGFEADWKIPFTNSLDFSITDALCNVERQNNQYNAYFAGNLALGDFAFRVRANYQDKAWDFSGSTRPGTSIHLGKVVGYIGEKLGAEIPSDLIDVQVKNLVVEFNTGTKAFRYHGDIETPPSITMGAVERSLALRADLSSRIDETTKKRLFEGKLVGELQVGHAKFTLSLGIGENNDYIRGSWIGQDGETVGISDFLEVFNIDYSIPSNIDFALTKATFEYNVSKEQFALSAESKNYGDAFIVMGKGDGSNWGLAFGLNFKPDTSFNGLGDTGKVLKSVEKIFPIEQAGVILATTKFDNYSMPALPAVTGGSQSTGTKASKPILPEEVLTLQEGISLAMVVNFGNAKNDQAKSMRKIVTQDKLVLQSTFDPGNLTSINVFAELEGSVGIPAGKDSSLLLANPLFKIKIVSDAIEFGIQGEVKFNVDDEMLDAKALVSVTETELNAGLTITTENASLPAPMGLKGLHLEDIGAEMGVIFEPPGVDLGLTGQFRIGERKKGPDDRFGFVLEMIEEVPNPLYLSFYLEEIDFAETITVFTDKDPNKLPSFFRAIKATQVSFYWADSIVVLPDGTIAQPGFGFSGNIKVFSFEAHASLEVGATKGIHGLAEMAPINLGKVLSVTGDGKGVSIKMMKDGSKWKRIDNKQIKRLPAGTETKQEVLVEPGGPQIMVSSSGPTYLDVNWKISLFNTLSEEVKAKITNAGFEFELEDKLSDIAGITLKCTLKNKDDFSASARVWLDLDAHIGPIKILGVDVGTIHLDTHLKGFMGVSITPQAFSLKINGSFEFDGHHLSLPELELTEPISSLKELPEAIIKHIEKEASEIFKEVFDELGKVFDEAKKEVEKIGKDIKEEAGKIEHAAAEEAKKIGEEAKEAVHKVEQEAKEVKKEAEKVEKEAVEVATKAAEEVEKIGKDAVEEAEKLGKEAEKIAKDAVEEVKKIGQAAVAFAEKLGKEAERVFDAAKEEVKKIAHAVAEEVNKIIGDARALASSVIHEAAKVASAIEHEAEKVFNEAKHLAEKAANAIKHAAKKVWHKLKHY